MEEIKLKVDRYTKVVLTVIALALCWLSVKPLFTAKETVDVDIVAVSAGSWGGGLEGCLPVEVTNWP